MKALPFLAALALAGPAVAQTHEPLTGALSGRSPHVMMRQIAAAPVPCHAVRASAPAGRQPTAAAPGCAATQTASRESAERTALGR